jgi:hypothetical protein
LSPDADDPALVDVGRAEAVIAAGCAHYLALGDRHSVTEVGGSGRIWYAGTPEPTGFDEEAPGEVLVVTLGRDDIEVRRRRVGRWTFRRLRASFTGDDELDAFAAELDGLPDKERTVLRLSLEGTLTLQGKARLDAILDEARHLFAGIDVSEGRSDLAVIPDDVDFADLELVGFAREALDELRAGAGGDGPDAATARDALGLLVRLAGRGA